MEEIRNVNKVLEQIVKDIEKNNLDERIYELDNKKINMDSTIKKDLKKAFDNKEKMGIYMFAYKFNNKLHFLKIGKANNRSYQRFYNQHYNLNAATSTLAKHLYFSMTQWSKDRISFLSDEDKLTYNKLKENKELQKVLKSVDEVKNDNKDELKKWMEENLVKINIILDKDLNTFVLNYFEAYLHLKFKPLYEGPINQKH